MRRRAEEEARRAGPWPPLTRAQLIAAAEALAAARPDVEAVYLFGSRARGRTHPGSDVDLAVLTEPQVPLSERISVQTDLARFLEDRLGVPVDVIVIQPDLSPGLLFDIFSVETILFARDRARAHRIACQARNEYRDLLPRLERAFARVQRRLEDWASATDRS
jgi:predicted nucleotidyltransferase